ncbi:hypothetical protein BLSTO_02356 [Blastocystis sp. subtype 1]
MSGVPFKVFLIASSLITHSIRGILTSVLSKNDDGEYDYSTVMATMLSEVAVPVVSYGVRKDPTVRKYFSFKEIMLWSVPAILYAIGHNMYYSIMSMVDTPVTIQVFASLETVIVGVFSVILMGKRCISPLFVIPRLSGIHWAAMLLICDSVASIQLSRSSTASFSDFPIYAAFLTIISTAIVACAGVCIEKLMKSHKDMSIFQQNIWLYFWGVVVNFVFLLFENGYNSIQQITLRNFNFFAILTNVCLVYMGIVTSAILKYLSTVVKAMTSSSALVVTSLISSVVFDTQLSLSFYLAVVNLSIAIFLYKTAPVPPPRKEEGGKAMELELEAIPTELPNLAVVEEKVADSIEIGDDEEEIVIRGSKV